MRNRIRIESDQSVVTNARIFFVTDDVGEDGEPIEVDISQCVTGVDLHLHVGEVASATLHVILVDGHVSADLTELVVKRMRPRRRLLDVTSWGSLAREYVA